MDSLDESPAGGSSWGSGLAWHEPELLSAYGSRSTAGPAARRSLAIILPLLRGESVTFKGQFYEANDVVLTPRGPRPDGPRIQIGAREPRMPRPRHETCARLQHDLLEHIEDTKK